MCGSLSSSIEDKLMEKVPTPVPPGYHTVTPYLIVAGGREAIEFYKKAFGAMEVFRMEKPDGKIGHAEIRVGDSPVMLADGCEEMGAKDPWMLKGSPVMMHLYVEEVDRFFERAVKAGAKVVRPVKDQFYGDRSGMVEDPFGHKWNISSRVEELSAEEIRQRATLVGSKN